MRRSAVAVVIFLAPQAVAVAPAVAQESADTQRLLQIIEEQQRRLEDQEAQLEQQKEALKALRKEVEAIQGRGQPAGTPPTGVASPTPAPATPGTEGLQSAVAAKKEDWQGSFGLQGTDTRMKISGFTELDVIHDSNDVLTPTAFVTQAIRTRGEGRHDGQTSFSIQATRLGIETRTPLAGSTAERPRRVTTFVSADFFNNLGSATPDLRLREAYGEVSNFRHSGGNLLLGQTWSTYTNLYSVPSTLEFWTPNSVFGARSPMVRWTQPRGDRLTFKVAAEAANLRNFELDDSDQIDSSDPAIRVENRPRWPDGVVALDWVREPFNLSAAVIARDLRARADDGHVESAFGWGTTFQGRIGMPGVLAQDFLQFQLTYGEGIGSLFNDFPPDAVYDAAANELKLLETLGVLVGYQHWWNPKFYSLGTWGWLWQDNRDVQLPTAYNETEYASLNLTWTPDPRWLLGGEVIYGSREDNDGTSGSNIRTVITGRFNF